MYRFLTKILKGGVLLPIALLFVQLHTARAQCPTGTYDFTIISNSGCAPRLVRVGSTHPGSLTTDSLAFYWNFGDKRGFNISSDTTYSQGSIPVGNYTIQMVVISSKFLTKGDTCANTSHALVIKGIGKPHFYTTTPKICDTPYNVILIDSTQGPVAKREWIIKSSPNTGTPAFYLDDTLGRDTLNVSKVKKITSPGSYDVYLNETDSSGCSKLDTANKFIYLPVALEPDICSNLNFGMYDRDSVTASFSPSFLVSGVDLTGASYSWNFGDGSTSTLKSPTHYYSTAGGNPVDSTKAHTYSVSLKITLKNGCVATYTQDSLVTNYLQIDAPNYYCKGAPATLHLTNSPFISSKAKFLYNTSLTSKHSTTGNNQNFVFSKSGYVDASINFTYLGRGNRCYTNAVYPRSFHILPPSADFSIKNKSNATCISPAKIVVTSLDTFAGARYYWYVYDTTYGKTFPLMAPFPKLRDSFSTRKGTDTLFMKATDSGWFSLKLVIKDPNGGKLTCQDSAFKWAYININRPVAAFKISSVDTCAGASIGVTNLTKPSDTGSFAPYSYIWKAVRTSPLPAITEQLSYSKYPGTIQIDSIGTFDVSLTVNQSNACQYISPATSVKIRGISANVTIDQLGFCPSGGSAALIAKITKASGTSGSPFNPLLKNEGYKWNIYNGGGKTFNGIKIYPTTVDTNWHYSTTGKGELYDSIYVDMSGSASTTFDYKLGISAQGCSTTLTGSSFIHLGTKASFRYDSIACANVPLLYAGTSQYNPNVFKWSVRPVNNPTAKYSVTTPSKDSTYITFVDTGIYNVKYQVSRGSLATTCLSVDSHNVHIIKPIASFSIKNTNLGCAPKYISDTALPATGIAKYIWDFGDKTGSDTVTSNFIDHIYYSNAPNGFTIRLIEVDNYGCIDTFIKPNYVKLDGPVPQFKLDKDTACGATSFTFTNTSYNIASSVDVQLEFHDGSRDVDFTKATSVVHTYYYTNTNVPMITDSPIVIASDSSGSRCYAYYIGSVTLFRPPSAIFSVNDSVGCSDLTVNFTDQSHYNDTTKNRWDFDGDGIIDAVGTAHPVHTYTTPGVYTASLYVSTGFCSDSMTKTNLITVYGHPKAHFTVSPDSACPGSPFLYTPMDSNGYPGAIATYAWDFGDGNTYNYTVTGSSTSTDTIINHSYDTASSGSHLIKLSVTNSNGCVSDTSLTGAFTFPYSIPSARQLLSVSVNDTATNGKSKIIVKWAPDRSGNFSKFDLYKEGVGDIASYNSPDSITLIDYNTLVHDSSYGYYLGKTDKCGFVSSPGIPHYTILLTVTPNAVSTSPSLKLTWNNYVGWTPTNYQIWKKTGPGTKNKFSLIARVPYPDTVFVDHKNVCNGLYSYLITAINPNDSVNYNSVSNKDSGSPNYTFQTKRLDLLYTTVMNDAYTVTKWTGVQQSNVREFIIDRMDSFSGRWNLNYDSVGPNADSFIDYKVKVYEQSYRYRIRVKDSCGNITDGFNKNEAGPSNPGTSMHMLDSVSGPCPNEKFKFLWNRYDSFSTGLQQYILQLKDNKGNWQNYKRLDSGTTIAFDDSIHIELNGAACYRIAAISNNDPLHNNFTSDTSYSNSGCLVNCGRVYLPDAFSPNGDGINDSFAVVSVALFNGSSNKDLQFTFRIFDRWGTQVWSATDVHAKWGGTFQNERPSGKTDRSKNCPPDIYVYELEAHSFDRTPFFKKGVITLIR